MADTQSYILHKRIESVIKFKSFIWSDFHCQCADKKILCISIGLKVGFEALFQEVIFNVILVKHRASACSSFDNSPFMHTDWGAAGSFWERNVPILVWYRI